jgi:hypothetical protein
LAPLGWAANAADVPASAIAKPIRRPRRDSAAAEFPFVIMKAFDVRPNAAAA